MQAFIYCRLDYCNALLAGIANAPLPHKTVTVGAEYCGLSCAASIGFRRSGQSLSSCVEMYPLALHIYCGCASQQKISTATVIPTDCICWQESRNQSVSFEFYGLTVENILLSALQDTEHSQMKVENLRQNDKHLWRFPWLRRHEKVCLLTYLLTYLLTFDVITDLRATGDCLEPIYGKRENFNDIRETYKALSKYGAATNEPLNVSTIVKNSRSILL